MTPTRILLILLLACCAASTGCRPAQPPQKIADQASPETTRRSRPVVDRAAEVEERHRWNLQTLVGDYNRAGRKNPKWDDDAREALNLFAKVRTRITPDQAADLGSQVSNRVAKALAAGCDEPLILYLAARYVHPAATADDPLEDLQHPVRPFAEAAEGILDADYSPVRKFYACLRATEWYLRNIHDGHISPEASRYRQLAATHLRNVVGDENTPGVEAAEAFDQMIISPKMVPKWRQQLVEELEPVLTRNWPDEPGVYLALGKYYRNFAWAARGTGYSSTVTEQGWKLFAERLTKAEQLLTRAWELDGTNPRVPLELMLVELGQGKGRKVMESWFQRAMAVETNFYEACQEKLYYLEPKWYGSEKAMLAFGRECATSKTWGGAVPLILADAHRRIAIYRGGDDARAYWRRPDVWKDVHQCFETFFALNPEAIGWRHNYAWYAYQCEQWEEAKRQFGLMGRVNYQYFGGRDAFEKMVRDVEEKTRNAPR